MLFGCTYWVLLLLMPVLNYTADEVEFVYKQFYDVSARKKQTDPRNSRICNDNVTRKKNFEEKRRSFVIWPRDEDRKLVF